MPLHIISSSTRGVRHTYINRLHLTLSYHNRYRQHKSGLQNSLCNSAYRTIQMFGINVQQSGRAESSKGGTAGPSKGGTAGPSKPQLRGTLMRLFRIKLIGAFTLITTVAVSWRIGVVQRRRHTYLEFYNNYDPRADFERMKKAGVFHSVQKDGTVGSI